MAIVLMICVAVVRLGEGFERLLLETGQTGAIDLLSLHRKVQQWFDPTSLAARVYPPASYVLLWPFLGWLDVTTARWLWAAMIAALLGWFALLLVRASGASQLSERLFVCLWPLSISATKTMIGNGQPVLLVLVPLLAGLGLLHWARRQWMGRGLAVPLILLSLVKPTISAPFFWIVTWCSGTLWPAILVASGYGALTLVALGVRDTGAVQDLQEAIRVGISASVTGAMGGGYGSLHDGLVAIGLEGWVVPGSLGLLLILGVWTHRYRHADHWLLIGVAAIVARLWTYHRVYDDLLVLLPMVALFRIAKDPPAKEGRDVWAGVLLAVTWVAMMVPSGLMRLPQPWGLLYSVGQPVLWILILGFLMIQARSGQPSIQYRPSPPPDPVMA